MTQYKNGEPLGDLIIEVWRSKDDGWPVKEDGWQRIKVACVTEREAESYLLDRMRTHRLPEWTRI